MKLIYYLLFTGLILIGCSKNREVITITESRDANENAELFVSARSSSERFASNFGNDNHTGHDHDHSGNPFDWVLPEGWHEKPETQMRLINLGIGSNFDAECYVSVLQGAGGGLAANINRWRSQMLLEPLSNEDIAGLPKKTLLGQDAVFTKFSGAFRGMGDDDYKQDYMLVGLILEHKGISIFIKMIGPQTVLEHELDNFEVFSKSLKLKDVPHNNSKPNTRSEIKKSIEFTWQVPGHWTEQVEQKMRMATYKIGPVPNAECYVVMLPGDAGGVSANINRWFKQMGHTINSTQLHDHVREIEILKSEAKLVEIRGDYTDMSGEHFNDFMMIGVIFSFKNSMIFIKMTGPESIIKKERQNFLTFCNSFDVL